LVNIFLILNIPVAFVLTDSIYIIIGLAN
jgi:hypothetical protein